MSDCFVNFDAHITGHWGEDGYTDPKPVLHCSKCGRGLYIGDDVWRTSDGDFCEDCAKYLYRETLEND